MTTLQDDLRALANDLEAGSLPVEQAETQLDTLFDTHLTADSAFDRTPWLNEVGLILFDSRPHERVTLVGNTLQKLVSQLDSASD